MPAARGSARVVRAAIGRTRQTAFDHREHFVERDAATPLDLHVEKLRLLLVHGRCRERDVVGPVWELRDLGDEWRSVITFS